MANPIAKEAEYFSDLPHETLQRKSGMDKGTLLGVLSGVLLIVIAILGGGGGAPEVFLNLNSFLIVLGGSTATTFIAFPSKKNFNDDSCHYQRIQTGGLPPCGIRRRNC